MIHSPADVRRERRRAIGKQTGHFALYMILCGVIIWAAIQFLSRG